MGVLELFATRMEFGLASYDDAAESSSGAETLKIETQQVTNPPAMLEKRATPHASTGAWKGLSLQCRLPASWIGPAKMLAASPS